MSSVSKLNTPVRVRKHCEPIRWRGYGGDKHDTEIQNV